LKPDNDTSDADAEDAGVVTPVLFGGQRAQNRQGGGVAHYRHANAVAAGRSERKWCDYVSFDPGMPERMQYWVNRLEPNDQRDAALEVEVAAFLDDLESALSRCKHLRSGAAGRRLLAPATREIQPCLV